jgi:hypothetical protein
VSDDLDEGVEVLEGESEREVGSDGNEAEFIAEGGVDWAHESFSGGQADACVPYFAPDFF